MDTAKDGVFVCTGAPVLVTGTADSDDADSESEDADDSAKAATEDTATSLALTLEVSTACALLEIEDEATVLDCAPTSSADEEDDAATNSLFALEDDSGADDRESGFIAKSTSPNLIPASDEEASVWTGCD